MQKYNIYIIINVEEASNGTCLCADSIIEVVTPKIIKITRQTKDTRLTTLEGWSSMHMVQDVHQAIDTIKAITLQGD